MSQSQSMLDIIYRDQLCVAINKPSGLLVHPSSIDRYETQFAMHQLRDQIGCHVYPIHRLDKPTSGVLLFAFDPAGAKKLTQLFEQRRVLKRYLAIVRGYPDSEGCIDHALALKPDTYQEARSRQAQHPQSAVTLYRSLATIELPVAIERYPASRYALIECWPLTGRKHQIRRHCKHMSHPIIGDSRYGRGRHNRYFKHTFGADRLLLHAYELRLNFDDQPQQSLTIRAPVESDMQSVIDQFNWTQSVSEASEPPEI